MVLIITLTSLFFTISGHSENYYVIVQVDNLGEFGRALEAVINI